MNDHENNIARKIKKNHQYKEKSSVSRNCYLIRLNKSLLEKITKVQGADYIPYKCTKVEVIGLLEVCTNCLKLTIWSEEEVLTCWSEK